MGTELRGYVSNGLFRIWIVYSLPVYLAASEQTSEFALNAFAVTFISELDDLPNEAWGHGRGWGGAEWLGVVGSGWEWSGVVGSGREWFGNRGWGGGATATRARVGGASWPVFAKPAQLPLKYAGECFVSPSRKTNGLFFPDSLLLARSAYPNLINFN